jgi:hypothetical protein
MILDYLDKNSRSVFARGHGQFHPWADLLTTDVNSHDSTKREDDNVCNLMGHKKCEFFGHVMILDSTSTLVYLDKNSCSMREVVAITPP